MSRFDQQEDPHKKKEEHNPNDQAKHEAAQAHHGLHGAFMDHLKSLQNSASNAVGKIHPGEALQHGKQAVASITDPQKAVESTVRHNAAGAAQHAAHERAGGAGSVAEQAVHAKNGAAAALDKVTHSKPAHETSSALGKVANHPAVQGASRAIDKINENPAMKTINKTLDKIPGHDLIEMGTPLGILHQGLRHKKDIEKAAGALKTHIDNGSQTSDASKDHKKH